MRRKTQCLLSLLLAAMLLGGCGTKLIELTEEEEDLIAASASYLLGKYNYQQRDGYRNVVVEEEKKSSETTETASVDTQNTDAQTPDASGETGVTQEPQEPAMEQTTLAEAIGYAGSVSVAYTGYTTAASYKEGNYYIVDADSGNTFLILNFYITNISDADVSVNTVQTAPSFSCCYDGTNTVPAEVTFALKCLASYEDTIAPRETKDAMLLFQIPEANVDAIGGIYLTVTENGTTKKIPL